MSSENHLGLPEEIFELILLKLDLEDLLACSQVCTGWRNSVNSNRIWENVCRRKIGAERLKADVENRKAFTPGKFEDVEGSEVENFTPICNWRLRYMHDVDLKRNWKTGRCTEEVIGYIEANLHDFETDYRVLLEPSMSRPSFSVYQLSPTPKLEEVVYFALQQPIPEFFKLLDNVLVVVQCTLLQVYTLSDGLRFNRPLVALFDKDHDHAKKIPPEPDLSDWYSRTVGLYPCDIYVRCDHNGRYFVGMYNETDFNDCDLHVWDLKGCTKIRKISLPEIPPGERILDVTFTLHKNILHFILKLLGAEFGSPYNSIYTYNIETSKYNGTVFRVNYVIPFVLFTEKLIISTNFQFNKLFINDFQPESQCLDTLETLQKIDCRTVQIFDHLLAYAEFDLTTRMTTVHVYDTGDRKHVDKFIVPQRKSAYSFHIFFERFMLVGTPMLLHLRDIKMGSIVRTVDCLNFIPPDPACTKMISEKPDGKLVLLNFW